MSVRILIGDTRERLRELPADSVDCVVTSPPYWGLRDYGVVGQLGLEATPDEHVAAMVDVFCGVRRVLRPDGVCFVNYGDSYATSVNGRSAADTKALGNDDRTFRDKPFSTAVGGLKPKDLCMVPFRFALAMQADGWWLRSVMPWVKRNGMPESINDRPATAVEYVFMFTRSARYWYDADAVRREMAPSSVDRLAQDVESQTGSMRANGGAKTNGPMKAVRGRSTYGRHTLGDAVPSGDRRDSDSRKYEGDVAESFRRHSGANPGSTLRALEKRKRAVPPRHAQYESSDQSGLDSVERGTRNFRNGDLFYESLAAPHGLLTDGEGSPLALDVPPQPFRDAHFATFPPKLIEPLIKAGCPKGGTVLDPFFGAGTTGMVADRIERNCIGIELNPEYAAIAHRRINGDAGMFANVSTEAAA